MSSAEKLPYKSRDAMKTIDVIFVSDDLVSEMIISRKDYERMLQKRQKEEEKEKSKEIGHETPVTTPKGRKRKVDELETPSTPSETPKKPKFVDDDLELALAALENIEVEKETVRKPSTLFDEEGDISAGKMYTFEAKNKYVRSPLAKTAMINSANTTPKSKPALTLEKIDEEPPLKQTPYSLRKRVIKDIKRIQKILENSDDEKDFSGSESEYSAESSGDEEEDEDADDTMQDKKPRNQSYFEIPTSSKRAFRNSKSMTTPRLTREAVDKVLEHANIGEGHKHHVGKLFRSNVALYDKWDFILRHNYNVLLYGVGSKKDLIDKYLSRLMNHDPVIKVNGFFPSITVKDILDQVCECLKIDPTGDALEKIEAKVKDYDIRIYVGINDLDGVMLRSKKNQQMLARLARLPAIRLVASVDHINSPLMWDHCLLTDFNWVWLDATTFIPYTEETSYEGSILLQSSGQQTLASLRSVFGSLTKNARELFLILVRNQASAEKGWQGMAFRELYHEGRRKLLVSADSALRLQLKEFIDHAVVKQKRTVEGEERFLISIEKSILTQFLNEQESL